MADTDESPDVRMAVLETQMKAMQDSLDLIRRELAQGFAGFETRHNITAELARQVTILQERSVAQREDIARCTQLVDHRNRELLDRVNELGESARYVFMWRGVAVVLALMVPVVGGFVLKNQSDISDSMHSLLGRVEQLEVVTHTTPAPTTHTTP